MSRITTRIWFRTTTTVLCLVFTWTSICQSAPVLPDLNLIRFKAAPVDFLIPQRLGTVEHSFRSPNPYSPWIIHIQSIHGDYAAQKSIESLLEYLNRTQNISLALLEGAHGALDPRLIEFFPRKETNLAIADRLARKGALTGAELFLLSHANDFKAFGVENPALYREDLRNFRRVMAKRAVAERFLRDLNFSLDQIIQMVEQKDLRQLLKAWKNFKENHDGFYPFAQTLIRMGRSHLNLDLANAENQFQWPQLLRLVLLMEMQGEIDQLGGAKEWGRLKNLLQTQNTNPKLLNAIDQMVAGGGADSAADETDLNLRARGIFEQVHAGSKGRIDFEDFPALSRIAAQAIFRDELEAKALEGEISRLVYRLVDKISKRPEEKEILNLLENLKLLAGLLRLELSREEAADLLGRKNFSGSVVAAQSDDLARALGAPSNAHFDTAENVVEQYAFEFYRGARERESALIENAVRNLSEKKAGRAVFITGGFHTEGIRESLERRQISYTVITPHVEDVNESRINYLRNIMGTHKTMFDEAASSKGQAARTEKERNGDSEYGSIGEKADFHSRRHPHTPTPPYGSTSRDHYTIESVLLLQFPSAVKALGGNPRKNAQLVLSAMLDEFAENPHLQRNELPGFRTTGLFGGRVSITKLDQDKFRITAPKGFLTRGMSRFEIAFERGKPRFISGTLGELAPAGTTASRETGFGSSTVDKLLNLAAKELLLGHTPPSLDLAKQHVEQAIALDPNHPRAYLELAYILYLQEEYRAAIKAAETALKISPGHEGAIQIRNKSRRLLRVKLPRARTSKSQKAPGAAAGFGAEDDLASPLLTAIAYVGSNFDIGLGMKLVDLAGKIQKKTGVEPYISESKGGEEFPLFSAVELPFFQRFLKEHAHILLTTRASTARSAAARQALNIIESFVEYPSTDHHLALARLGKVLTERIGLLEKLKGEEAVSEASYSINKPVSFWRQNIKSIARNIEALRKIFDSKMLIWAEGTFWTENGEVEMATLFEGLPELDHMIKFSERVPSLQVRMEGRFSSEDLSRILEKVIRSWTFDRATFEREIGALVNELGRPSGFGTAGEERKISVVVEEPMVIASGGNAFQITGTESFEEQKRIVKATAYEIAKVIATGRKVILTHGNGPQVGMLMEMVEKGEFKWDKGAAGVRGPPTLADLGEFSQELIFGWLKEAFEEAFRQLGITRKIEFVKTHVIVDPNDPQFSSPLNFTKFVGNRFTQAELQAKGTFENIGTDSSGKPIWKLNLGSAEWIIKEQINLHDPDRRFRRVVPSPDPKGIVELDEIKRLLKTDSVIVAGGGGGIPVVDKEGKQRIDAVIDKDLTSALLADQLGAREFVILTGVDRVALDFGKPEQTFLSELTVAKAGKYLSEGQFPPGSMGPKILAGIKFAEQSPAGVQRSAIVTDAEHLLDALEGQAGSRIVPAAGFGVRRSRPWRDKTKNELSQAEKPALVKALKVGMSTRLASLGGGSKNLVDIGGGTGELAKALAPLFGKIFVLEQNPKQLNALRSLRESEPRIIPLGFSFMDFNPQEAIDGVLLSHVLFLTPREERNQLLRQALSIVKPGGFAAIVLNSATPEPGNHVHFRDFMGTISDRKNWIRGTEHTVENRLRSWGYSVEIEKVRIEHSRHSADEMVNLVSLVLQSEDRVRRSEIRAYVEKFLKTENGYSFYSDQEILWATVSKTAAAVVEAAAKPAATRTGTPPRLRRVTYVSPFAQPGGSPGSTQRKQRTPPKPSGQSGGERGGRSGFGATEVPEQIGDREKEIEALLADPNTDWGEVVSKAARNKKIVFLPTEKIPKSSTRRIYDTEHLHVLLAADLAVTKGLVGRARAGEVESLQKRLAVAVKPAELRYSRDDAYVFKFVGYYVPISQRQKPDGSKLPRVVSSLSNFAESAGLLDHNEIRGRWEKARTTLTEGLRKFDEMEKRMVSITYLPTADHEYVVKLLITRGIPVPTIYQDVSVSIRSSSTGERAVGPSPLLDVVREWARQRQFKETLRQMDDEKLAHLSGLIVEAAGEERIEALRRIHDETIEFFESHGISVPEEMRTLREGASEDATSRSFIYSPLLNLVSEVIEVGPAAEMMKDVIRVPLQESERETAAVVGGASSPADSGAEPRGETPRLRVGPSEAPRNDDVSEFASVDDGVIASPDRGEAISAAEPIGEEDDAANLPEVDEETQIPAVTSLEEAASRPVETIAPRSIKPDAEAELEAVTEEVIEEGEDDDEPPQRIAEAAGFEIGTIKFGRAVRISGAVGLGARLLNEDAGGVFSYALPTDTQLPLSQRSRLKQLRYRNTFYLSPFVSLGGVATQPTSNGITSIPAFARRTWPGEARKKSVAAAKLSSSTKLLRNALPTSFLRFGSNIHPAFPEGQYLPRGKYYELTINKSSNRIYQDWPIVKQDAGFGAEAELAEENQGQIRSFLAEYSSMKIRAMNSALQTTPPESLRRWLTALEEAVHSPALSNRRVFVKFRRLVAFDSFDAPVSVVHVPDQLISEITITTNEVMEIEQNVSFPRKRESSSGQTPMGIQEMDSPVKPGNDKGAKQSTSFKDLLTDALADKWSDFYVPVDEHFDSADESLANRLSRDFFWKRLDIWIEKTGRDHEAGHREDKPKLNKVFIRQSVADWVGALRRKGPLPEKIRLAEFGAAKAELVFNWLREIETNHPDIFRRVEKVYLIEFAKEILLHGRFSPELEERYGNLIERVYYKPGEFPQKFFTVDGESVDLEGKIHVLMHNNVFDQMASRIIKRINGRFYEEEARLFIDSSNPAVRDFLTKNRWELRDLQARLRKSLQRGDVEHLIGSAAEDYPRFDIWTALFSRDGGRKALRFERRLRPIENLDDEFQEEGEELGLPFGQIIEETLIGTGDAEMLVNTEALEYFIRSFKLLASGAHIQMIDLFTEIENESQIHTRDVLRMDGSLITPLNAKLFKVVAQKVRPSAAVSFDMAGRYVERAGGKIKGIGTGILRVALPPKLKAQEKLDRGEFTVTVEWPGRKNTEAIESLLASLPFDAVSFTDIPPEVTSIEAAKRQRDFRFSDLTVNRVAHIAGHVRSAKGVEEKILEDVHQKGARGLLVISGGGPLRQLLSSKTFQMFMKAGPVFTVAVLHILERLAATLPRLLPSPRRSGKLWPLWPFPKELSLSGLFKLAALYVKAGAAQAPETDSEKIVELINRMKQSRLIDEDIPVWLAASPVTDSPSRIAGKIRFHPGALVSQPSFDDEQFEEWMAALRNFEGRDLTKEVPLIMSVAIPASSNNLKFWYGLIGDRLWFLPWRNTYKLWRQFAEAEKKKGKEYFNRFSIDWTVRQMIKLKNTPGVAGVHLSPMSPAQAGLLPEILRRSGLTTFGFGVEMGKVDDPIEVRTKKIAIDLYQLAMGSQQSIRVKQSWPEKMRDGLMYFGMRNRFLKEMILRIVTGQGAFWEKARSFKPVNRLLRFIAERFILPGGDFKNLVVPALAERMAEGLGSTLDLVGDKAVSEDSAGEYLRQIKKQLFDFSRPQIRRTLEHAAGSHAVFDDSKHIPLVHISIKLSALVYGLSDNADKRKLLKEHLRLVLREASVTDAFVRMDAEEYALRNLTIDIFKEVVDENPEWAVRDKSGNLRIGVVIQTYFKDSIAELEKLQIWAERRGYRVPVRLVKGAYYEYEKSTGSPVFERKESTDANFEAASAYVLENIQYFIPAFGTHNVRSIAKVMALADHFGVPKPEIEFQMLRGMGEPLKQAVRTKGYRQREYVPYGDLVSGLGYLSRRLVENSSQDSFLTGMLSGKMDLNTILKKPAMESLWDFSKYAAGGFVSDEISSRNDQALKYLGELRKNKSMGLVSDIQKASGVGLFQALKIAGEKVSPQSFPSPKIHVETEGDGEVTLVFIHGLGQDLKTWRRHVAERLGEKGFRIVMVDLRGHGASDWPGMGADEQISPYHYQVDIMAADVKRALDGLGIHDAVVIGHSLGARVALSLAAQFPGLVRRLIAEDSGFNGAVQKTRTANILRSALRIKERYGRRPTFRSREELKGFFRVQVANWMGKGEDEAFVESSVDKIAVKLDDGSYQAIFHPAVSLLERSFTVTDMGDELKWIRAAGIPLTVIVPESRPGNAPGVFRRAQKNHLKKFYPEAKILTVSGAEHSVHSSRPETFTNFVAALAESSVASAVPSEMKAFDAWLLNELGTPAGFGVIEEREEENSDIPVGEIPGYFDSEIAKLNQEIKQLQKELQVHAMHWLAGLSAEERRQWEDELLRKHGLSVEEAVALIGIETQELLQRADLLVLAWMVSKESHVKLLALDHPDLLRVDWNKERKELLAHAQSGSLEQYLAKKLGAAGWKVDGKNPLAHPVNPLLSRRWLDRELEFAGRFRRLDKRRSARHYPHESWPRDVQARLEVTRAFLFGKSDTPSGFLIRRTPFRRRRQADLFILDQRAEGSTKRWMLSLALTVAENSKGRLRPFWFTDGFYGVAGAEKRGVFIHAHPARPPIGWIEFLADGKFGAKAGNIFAQDASSVRYELAERTMYPEPGPPLTFVLKRGVLTERRKETPGVKNALFFIAFPPAGQGYPLFRPALPREFYRRGDDLELTLFTHERRQGTPSVALRVRNGRTKDPQSDLMFYYDAGFHRGEQELRLRMMPRVKGSEPALPILVRTQETHTEGVYVGVILEPGRRDMIVPVTGKQRSREPNMLVWDRNVQAEQDNIEFTRQVDVYQIERGEGGIANVSHFYSAFLDERNAGKRKLVPRKDFRSKRLVGTDRYLVELELKRLGYRDSTGPVEVTEGESGGLVNEILTDGALSRSEIKAEFNRRGLVVDDAEAVLKRPRSGRRPKQANVQEPSSSRGETEARTHMRKEDGTKFSGWLARREANVNRLYRHAFENVPDITQPSVTQAELAKRMKDIKKARSLRSHIGVILRSIELHVQRKKLRHASAWVDRAHKLLDRVDQLSKLEQPGAEEVLGWIEVLKSFRRIFESRKFERMRGSRTGHLPVEGYDKKLALLEGKIKTLAKRFGVHDGLDLADLKKLAEEARRSLPNRIDLKSWNDIRIALRPVVSIIAAEETGAGKDISDRFVLGMRAAVQAVLQETQFSLEFHKKLDVAVRAAVRNNHLEPYTTGTSGFGAGFDLDATIQNILTLFKDPKRNTFPTQMELAKALGPSQTTFSNHMPTILTALKERLKSEGIDTGLKERLDRATADYEETLSARLEQVPFDLDATIQNILTLFKDPKRNTFPTQRELSKALGPSQTTFSNHMPTILTALGDRLKARDGDSYGEVRGRIMTAYVDRLIRYENALSRTVGGKASRPENLQREWSTGRLVEARIRFANHEDIVALQEHVDKLGQVINTLPSPIRDHVYAVMGLLSENELPAGEDLITFASRNLSIPETALHISIDTFRQRIIASQSGFGRHENKWAKPPQENGFGASVPSVLHGKDLAQPVTAETLSKLESLGQTKPTLAVLFADHAGNRAYFNSMQRYAGKTLNGRVQVIGENVGGRALPELREIIQRWNEDGSVHGIVVLREQIAEPDYRALVSGIRPEKNVEGVNIHSLLVLSRSEDVARGSNVALDGWTTTNLTKTIFNSLASLELPENPDYVIAGNGFERTMLMLALLHGRADSASPRTLSRSGKLLRAGSITLVSKKADLENRDLNGNHPPVFIDMTDSLKAKISFMGVKNSIAVMPVPDPLEAALTAQIPLLESSEAPNAAETLFTLAKSHTRIPDENILVIGTGHEGLPLILRILQGNPRKLSIARLNTGRGVLSRFVRDSTVIFNTANQKDVVRLEDFRADAAVFDIDSEGGVPKSAEERVRVIASNEFRIGLLTTANLMHRLVEKATSSVAPAKGFGLVNRESVLAVSRQITTDLDGRPVFPPALMRELAHELKEQSSGENAVIENVSEVLSKLSPRAASGRGLLVTLVNGNVSVDQLTPILLAAKLYPELSVEILFLSKPGEGGVWSSAGRALGRRGDALLALGRKQLTKLGVERPDRIRFTPVSHAGQLARLIESLPSRVHRQGDPLLTSDAQARRTVYIYPSELTRQIYEHIPEHAVGMAYSMGFDTLDHKLAWSKLSVDMAQAAIFGFGALLRQLNEAGDIYAVNSGGGFIFRHDLALQLMKTIQAVKEVMRAA